MNRNELLKLCSDYLESIPKNLNYLTPVELLALIEIDPDKIFLLDTRTEESFNQYHIPGAVNIPLRSVLQEKNLSQLPVDKPIVVCCWVGHTASQVLAILQILGYNALGLKYGYGESAIKGEDQRGWYELNFPIE